MDSYMFGHTFSHTVMRVVHSWYMYPAVCQEGSRAGQSRVLPAEDGQGIFGHSLNYWSRSVECMNSFPTALRWGRKVLVTGNTLCLQCLITLPDFIHSRLMRSDVCPPCRERTAFLPCLWEFFFSPHIFFFNNHAREPLIFYFSLTWKILPSPPHPTLFYFSKCNLMDITYSGLVLF